MIVKVCGLREGQNIRDIEAAGADWIGFIFYKESPRYCAVRPDYLPERAIRVGVFVEPTFGEVVSKVDEYGLQAVQLHGAVCREQARKLKERGLTVVRAIPATAKAIQESALWLGCADYLLFDTPTERHGGSGRPFDHSLLDHYAGNIPFILSGGIAPEDAESLAQFHLPAFVGVDLNSRFETAPGVKDAAKVKQFISTIQES